MKRYLWLIAVLFVGLSIMASGMPVMASEATEPEVDLAPPPYIEVVVPAEWIPIDPSTGEVISQFGTRKTEPGMYSRSEVAKLDEETGQYMITYMGTPVPLSEGSWSANNFMYTANIFFRNKFYRTIGSVSTSNPSAGPYAVSSVMRLEYGTHGDGDFVNGLHGMTETPYQEGKTLKLYAAAEEGNLSEVELDSEVVTVFEPTSTTDLLDRLAANILSYTYLCLDPLSYSTSKDFDKVLIYHYNSLESEDGAYLMEGGEKLNLKEMNDEWAEGLSAGKYEVVFPFYMEVPTHEWLSAPDVFSRNRYRMSDSIHFTLIIEKEKVTIPDPVYPEDVTVKYVDKDGNNVVDPVILSGRLGASWKAEEKSIDGWTIAERPSVVSGVFTAYAQEVIFVYERVTVGAGDVTVKYVDEDGNDIVDPVILTGKIGESWKAEEKDIIGWVLSVIPDNVSGTFTSESQIVIFVYKEEVVKGAEDDEDETPDDLNPPVTGEPALYMLLAILMVLGGTLLTVPSLKRAWAKNKRED